MARAAADAYAAYVAQPSDPSPTTRVAPVPHGRLLWAGDIGHGIHTIDPETGTINKVLDVSATPGISSWINDLAYDAGSGLLYGISGGGLLDTPNTLFTIDLRSPGLDVTLLGTVTPPHPDANSIAGLTFDETGTLYGVEWSAMLDDQLFTIDPVTLAIGNVYDLPSPADYNMCDLARGPNPGKILASKALDYQLFEITLPQGPPTLIGEDSAAEFVWGLAYATQQGTLYACDSSGRVLEIDPADGSVIGVIATHSVGLHALEFVVPEPATLALLTMGALVLLPIAGLALLKKLTASKTQR